jgi:hypothetical protein
VGDQIGFHVGHWSDPAFAAGAIGDLHAAGGQ